MPNLVAGKRLALALAVLLGASPGAARSQAPAAAPAPQSPAEQAQPIAQAVTQPTPEQEGDALMGHQRYQAAIAAYKKQTPVDAALLNKLGIAYQMLFNLTEAMHCYQASLKLEPKNPHVLNNLGTVYDSMKEYGSAERMYRRALKIDPHSALVLKNLGTNLLSQHKTKKGWEAYQAALAADPNVFQDSGSPHVENPASLQDRGAMNYYMARTCVKAGQNDRAIEYLRMALNEGYTNAKKLLADNDFAPLWGTPAFEQLLAAQRAQ
ncbi:MAG: tetratricopeptide repeat protein [Terracidiphilus sp.]